MIKEKEWKKWIAMFIFAVLLIVIYKALDNFYEIRLFIRGFFKLLNPFLYGILIAYLLYIPCKGFERLCCKSKIKIIARKYQIISIALVYILATIMIVVVFNFGMPLLVKSITEIINNIPTYYDDLMELIDKIPQDSIFAKLNIKDKVNEFFNNYANNAIGEGNVWNYISSVFSVAGTLFKAILSIILSVYMLSERKQILRFSQKASKILFSKKTYENIRIYFSTANIIFFRYISSKVIESIIIASASFVVLVLLDVKYAILLGIMTGILNLIPYFGSIVSAFICGVIALFTGGFQKAIILLAILLVLEQLDGNILAPKLIGNNLKVSPILVLLAIIIGGAYFGPIGMFLSVPVVTVIKIIITDCLNKKAEQKM